MGGRGGERQRKRRRRPRTGLRIPRRLAGRAQRPLVPGRVGRDVLGAGGAAGRGRRHRVAVAGPDVLGHRPAVDRCPGGGPRPLRRRLDPGVCRRHLVAVRAGRRPAGPDHRRGRRDGLGGGLDLRSGPGRPADGQLRRVHRRPGRHPGPAHPLLPGHDRLPGRSAAAGDHGGGGGPGSRAAVRHRPRAAGPLLRAGRCRGGRAGHAGRPGRHRAGRGGRRGRPATGCPVSGGPTGLLHQVVRFLLGSCLGLAVDLAVFQAAVLLGATPGVANAISSGCAVVVVYLFVTKYAFSAERSRTSFLLFVGWYVTSIVIFSVLIEVLHGATGWLPFVCKLVSLPLSFAANFGASKVLFGRRGDGPATPAGGSGHRPAPTTPPARHPAA
ncbi:hypothetical protein GCU49_06835 [Modestobacter roseus]|nr:hypothetical protein [Modestobacter roseus]